MATIYLKDEIVEKIDNLVKKYNEKNPATDRSGMVEHLIEEYEKKKK